MFQKDRHNEIGQWTERSTNKIGWDQIRDEHYLLLLNK